MIYHAGVREESTDRWADGEGNNYGSGGGLTDAELNDILRRHLFAKIIPFFLMALIVAIEKLEKVISCILIDTIEPQLYQGKQIQKTS